MSAAALAAYVLLINPTFPYPQDAGAALVKLEREHGVPRELFAALVTLESGWGNKLDRHPWNLSQITRRNAIRELGHPVRGWVDSLTAGAMYFSKNLRAAAARSSVERERWRRALAHYNTGSDGLKSERGRTYARVVLKKYDHREEGLR